MDPKSVAAGRAVTWFSCGWNIFMKSPGMWVLIAVVIGVLAAVLKSVSLGRYVLLLFAPAIGAGLLCGAADVRAGQPFGLAHLMQGFRDQTKFVQLIVLGGVALAVAVVSRLTEGVFLADLMRASTDDLMTGAVRPSPVALLALLFILTLQLIATLLLYYAVPLVVFRDAPASIAMQSSARACLRNVLPLFVFSLIYSGILIVLAGIGGLLGRFGLLLPAVILLPWTIGMIYCSYEDIYAST